MRRIVGHLDMDAFFAAIEERDTPRFRGLPIVVGADPRKGFGRGVVSTANYPARAYGIRSAQPITTAWRLSEAARRRGQPPAIFLSGDFRRYEVTSHRIMEILRNRVPRIQQQSVDEAYLELSFTGSAEAAGALCRNLKQEIWDKEQLTTSVGIGPNKLIAKIASDSQKPDGLTLVLDTMVETFLASLPIRAIPGVGPKTEELLARHGVRFVHEGRMLPRELWQQLLGAWGIDIADKLWGRDNSPVCAEESPLQSLGKHVTFPIDTLRVAFVGEHLTAMSLDLIRRLREEGFRAFRTIVLTVRFADFHTVSRARTVQRPLSTQEALLQYAFRLLLPFFDARENPRHHLLRMIGLRLEKLQ